MSSFFRHVRQHIHTIIQSYGHVGRSRAKALPAARERKGEVSLETEHPSCIARSLTHGQDGAQNEMQKSFRKSRRPWEPAKSNYI